MIEVVKISDITNEEIVARELALIKVAANAGSRGAIIEIAGLFRANIIDVAAESVIVEVTGTEDKIEAIYEMLLPFGIKEMVRTGRIAMSRGGMSALAIDGVDPMAPRRRYRSAGEGKAQVGSLL